MKSVENVKQNDPLHSVQERSRWWCHRLAILDSKMIGYPFGENGKFHFTPLVNKNSFTFLHDHHPYPDVFCPFTRDKERSFSLDSKRERMAGDITQKEILFRWSVTLHVPLSPTTTTTTTMISISTSLFSPLILSALPFLEFISLHTRLAHFS